EGEGGRRAFSGHAHTIAPSAFAVLDPANSIRSNENAKYPPGGPAGLEYGRLSLSVTSPGVPRIPSVAVGPARRPDRSRMTFDGIRSRDQGALASRRHRPGTKRGPADRA